MAMLDGMLFEPDSKIYSNERDYEPNPENINITKRNSLDTLHGWLFRTDQHPKGLVVQCHGNAENITSHACYASWFVRIGFDVLCWDYRGYGRSPGIPTKSGLVEDMDFILKYARNIKRGPSTIMLGQSLGAAILLNGLKNMPQFNPTLVILDGAFSSFQDLASIKIKQRYPIPFLQKLTPLLFSGTFNAEDAILSLTSPLLCIHSKKDQIIPIELHRRIYDKAPSDKKCFWEDNDQKHLDTFRSDISPYRQKTADYIRDMVL